MMFGQVEGPICVSWPRKIWNDIVLSDFQYLTITCACCDAQNNPAWQVKNLRRHTHLATAGMHNCNCCW